MEATYAWVRHPADISDYPFTAEKLYVQVTDVETDEIDAVPVELYNACIRHFARHRMIGRAVPCPGCDWDGCVDCNPELEPEVRVESYDPAHPEWLAPENLAAIHAAIDEIEARMSE